MCEDAGEGWRCGEPVSAADPVFGAGHGSGVSSCPVAQLHRLGLQGAVWSQLKSDLKVHLTSQSPR